MLRNCRGALVIIAPHTVTLSLLQPPRLTGSHSAISEQ